ncbi:MAG TPA: hypothetical protein PK969_02655 [Treponemataceae bacterium]|nr:hypothetical protein [Treponemataceae bacterium]
MHVGVCEYSVKEKICEGGKSTGIHGVVCRDCQTFEFSLQVSKKTIDFVHVRTCGAEPGMFDQIGDQTAAEQVDYAPRPGAFEF